MTTIEIILALALLGLAAYAYINRVKLEAKLATLEATAKADLAALEAKLKLHTNEAITDAKADVAKVETDVKAEVAKYPALRS